MYAWFIRTGFESPAARRVRHGRAGACLIESALLAPRRRARES
ncbi:hypothetical protein [Bordetella pertussis]|nr:hypothetical protein [Bordetella pertussis]